MMNKLVIFLLLNGLFITTAQARNCAQALHNKHCSSSSGVSALTSQGSTVIGSTGQSPNPAQTNNHLGTGSNVQTPKVKIDPVVPHKIVGQAHAPKKLLMNIPPKATVTAPPLLPNKTPMVVPLQPVVNVPPKATVTAPPLLPNKTPMVVPLQPVMNVPPKATVIAPPLLPNKTPMVVPMQPVVNVPPKATVTVPPLLPNKTPMVVPSQPVMNVPPKATVTAPPLLPNKTPMVVPMQPVVNVPPKATVTVPPLLPNKTPMVVPMQPVVNVPPLVNNSKPPLQVYMVPSKVITGTAPVTQQPITTAPPKTFTGQTQQQVYPVQAPILIGYAAIPVKPVMNVPPKATVTVPSLLPNKTPMLVPTQPVMNVPPKATVTAPPLLPNKTPMLVPSQQPLTPVLITHVASSNLHPHVLLQQQMLHGSSALKSLEPHIKGLPVDVYTGKNVYKTTYEKSTSINSKGFHLTVLGVKEPTFVDTAPLPVAVKPDDIIFNFSYASAEIHKDQLSQIDKIIAVHSKNGKRIILMGETDGFGSETYNKHLAVLRANKIIDALKARGVKIDDIEVRILVRCCRKDHPNKETLAETSEQRITWVHFQ